MSIRHTSGSGHHSTVIFQEPKIIQDLEGKVLLLRRRKSCKICGRIHGAPLERCQPETTSPEIPSASGDLHLPWIF